MPRARKHLVCVEDTPYYHVTSRCVRRAFLCGQDRLTGVSYEHRRGWIENRIRVLSSLFSIEICAYAVMSNHYHLVVRINVDEPRRWSDDEVLKRWSALFKGPLIVQRYRQGETLSSSEADTLQSVAAVYRARLGSLSWFMKCLNEPIARKANAEDCCTGHFWEARFHSQALCSDRAVLTAMAYVDLNPVRAGIARTPESSKYTSIRARLRPKESSQALRRSIRSLVGSGGLRHFDVPIRALMAFAAVPASTGARRPADPALPIQQSEYLVLVDETGQAVAAGKRGRIDPKLSTLLDQIGCSTEQWFEDSTTLRHRARIGDRRRKRLA